MLVARVDGPWLDVPQSPLLDDALNVIRAWSDAGLGARALECRRGLEGGQLAALTGDGQALGEGVTRRRGRQVGERGRCGDWHAVSRRRLEDGPSSEGAAAWWHVRVDGR